MATVAEFTVDPDVFPLGTVFQDLPGVQVELDRVVPTEESVIPYFWVEGADVDDIVAHFSEHPGVRDIEAVDRFDARHLVRCRWVAEYAGILAGLTEASVALLAGVGTADEWRFEVRSDTREAMSEFQQYCADEDIPIRVTTLQTLAPVDTDRQMTDAQREALLLAYEEGYYDSPRTATLSELGEQLGISQQALGDRLRRGTRRLIADELADS